MQPIQAVGAWPIAPQRLTSASPAGTGSAATSAAGAPSFKELLAESLERAGAGHSQAGNALAPQETGRAASLSGAIATAERADATLRTAMQVHDAVMSAYREFKDLRV